MTPSYRPARDQAERRRRMLVGIAAAIPLAIAALVVLVAALAVWLPRGWAGVAATLVVIVLAIRLEARVGSRHRDG